MFTFEELFIAFLISIVFIIIFKLHNTLFPSSYFSMSEFISDYKHSPKLSNLLIRFLIIFVLGIALSFFVKNENVIIFGITLGSFLTVWPAFLSDKNINPKLLDDKHLLYTLLSIFVISTFFIAKLSTFLYHLSNEIFTSYFSQLSWESIIYKALDNILWMLIFLFLIFIERVLGKILNVRINVKKVRGDFEEKTIEQIGATKESGHE